MSPLECRGCHSMGDTHRWRANTACRFDSIESMNAEELLVKRKRGSKKFVIGAGVIGGLFFLVGILIGYFSHKGGTPHDPEPPPHTLNPPEYIIQHVNENFLQSKLKEFSAQPRLAGTDGASDLAQTIQSLWSGSGLDRVHITSYNILLSLPNQAEPNKVELINKTSGKAIFTSLSYEPDLRPEENESSVMNFNGFSPAGSVMGDLVYANYGRFEDFEYLTKNLSMDLSGKIVIVRYGKIFRANKMYNAEQHNASAMVLYSDPADVNTAANEGDREKPYPESWWMPDTGVQRGNVYRFSGDPNTPVYPSTDYAFISSKLRRPLPKIPCQPVSYGDALQILSNMSGSVAPSSWHGSLPIEYRIGPGYENGSDLEVKVTVNNELKIRPAHNVIGILEGREEPDRYILLGNHHDAWVYGATDPQIGGAALSHVVDLFGQLTKLGYRPRRTLIFCSWDAEEYGLIGSTEWVEDNFKVIYERAVAYLNVDMAVRGNFSLKAAISPLLQDALYSAAKLVPSPVDQYKTLYDLWLARPVDGSKTDNDEEPRVSYSLGGGSDHMAFYTTAGVPCADLRFTYDEEKYPITDYPLYHSRYDNFYYYDKLADPGYVYAKTMTQFWAILANYLAETSVLPLKVTQYSTAVNQFINDLISTYGKEWEKNNINVDALLSAVSNFTTATQQFEKLLASEQDLEKRPYRLRMYNDKMMQLERAFINPEGLPDRPEYNFKFENLVIEDMMCHKKDRIHMKVHVVFANSNFDSYTDTFFPGISDTMFNINHGLDQWDRLKKQIYITTFFIQSAARTLQDIGL